MKKILFIGTTNIYGGVGHIMFELCKNLNRNEFQFDFLYYEEPTTEEKEVIRKLGASFFLMPRYSRNPLRFYHKIKEFYQMHHYDIVHIHASSAMLMMYAIPVWKKKNVKIVCQSHVNLIQKMYNQILHHFFRIFVNRYTNCRLAVSQIAAEFMYGKENVDQTVILKNGIHIEDFLFEEATRGKIRKALNMDSKFVIGHVGRFSALKNQTFLIDLFAHIYENNPNAVLLLIGNGEDEAMIRNRVQRYHLEDSVIFYGTSNCVGELFCAMDCFVFPSLGEGFGIAAIEAQASGLPVVASTKVPQEAHVSDLLIYKDLEDALEEWSELILKMETEVHDRKKYNEIVAESGYNIKKVAKQLEKIYLEV